MSNLEHQNAETGPLPMSDLTRRLVRRATEPIGVIDTRHAFELHARSTVLPAQRLGLAKELATRYGVEPTDGGSQNNTFTVDMPLVSPKQNSESPFQLGSAPPWGSATVPAENPKNLDLTPSPAQYRVKRPGPYTAPLSAPVTGERVADAGVQANTPIVAPQVRPQMEPAQAVVDTTLETARASLSKGEVSQRATHGSTAPLPKVNEVPHIDVAAQTPVQRQSRSAAIDPIVVLPEDSTTAQENAVPRVIESPQTAVTPQMPLPSATIAASTVVDSAAIQPVQESVSALRAFISGDSKVIERQPQGGTDEPVRGLRIGDSPNPALRPAGANPASSSAVVAETQVPPSPMAFPSIVWRKAESSAASITMPQRAAWLSGPSYSSETPIMRQAASEPMASGPDSHVALPGSANGGIDLTRVAEQVSRILTRQLRTSRERRGRTR